ncbi:MAG: hypothetical protein ACI8X5_002147 [Planctomycetota bacterium]|jgi:hypothetical protein
MWPPTAEVGPDSAKSIKRGPRSAESGVRSGQLDGARAKDATSTSSNAPLRSDAKESGEVRWIKD